MVCRICLNVVIENALNVKEMMFGTGKLYPYYKCSFCGCMQIEEPENNPENLYPSSYYSFNTYKTPGIIEKIKRMVVRYSVAESLGYKSILNYLFAKKQRDCGGHALKGRCAKNAVLLDVGCGDGSLIDALNWCGFTNLTGIDPYLNSDVIKTNYQLLKKGIEAFEGEEIFDVIMLHHSFEHVENPLEILKNVKRLLKKDGFCMIRIPVSDSYAFDFYKENWIQLDAPRHVFLHTNKSMEIATQKSNLKIVSIVNDSMEFQFVGSEQYKNGIPLNDPRSYYISPLKKLFFNKKHIFSAEDIDKFKRESDTLNAEGKGDQRIYYIQHADS